LIQPQEEAKKSPARQGRRGESFLRREEETFDTVATSRRRGRLSNP
jgi:hypothetical protein